MSTTYDGFGTKSPQWWPSRYGASDQAGALAASLAVI